MNCQKALPPHLSRKDLADDATVQTTGTELSTTSSTESSSSSALSVCESNVNCVNKSTSSNQYSYHPTRSLVAQTAQKELQDRLSDRLSLQQQSLHLESMKESFDLEVLTQFYNELMVPNFPLEEERDDLEDWLLYLDPANQQKQKDDEEDSGEDGPSMDVIILRASSSTGVSTIIGGIAFEYYPQARAGLLSYMVVSSDFRRLGILATLHPVFCHALEGLHQEATQTSTNISAILAETNTTTAGDVPEAVARKRHEILYKLGYRLLEFPYVQPPLAPDVGSFDDIMLLVFVGKNDQSEDNDDGTTENATVIPTQVLHDYVLDFYHSVFGYNSLDFQDHWYYQLVTWYAEHNPTTKIQLGKPPWDDVTPQMTQEMAEMQQCTQQQK